jgi:predicted TIM-barrel fold metal-dependent hydrolase
LEVIKPERLIFATDYPQNFNNSDPKLGKSIAGVAEYIELIRRLPLAANSIEDMLGGSAARLLNL